MAVLDSDDDRNHHNVEKLALDSDSGSILHKLMKQSKKDRRARKVEKNRKRKHVTSDEGHMKKSKKHKSSSDKEERRRKRKQEKKDKKKGHRLPEGTVVIEVEEPAPQLISSFPLSSSSITTDHDDSDSSESESESAPINIAPSNRPDIASSMGHRIFLTPNTQSRTTSSNTATSQSSSASSRRERAQNALANRNTSLSSQRYAPITNPLHTTRITSAEIKRLEAEGVEIRRGPYAPSEDVLLKTLIKQFQEANNLKHVPPAAIICPSEWKKLGNSTASKTMRDDFYAFISPHFPARTMKSLRFRIKLLHNPNVGNVTWTADEKMQIVDLVAQWGHDWVKIGQHVGRIPDNCHNIYRQYVERLKTTGSGANIEVRSWTDTELAVLLEIVVLQYLNGREVQSFTKDLLQEITDKALKKVNWDVVEQKFNDSDEITTKKTRSNVRDKWTQRLMIMLQRTVTNFEGDLIPFNQLFVHVLHIGGTGLMRFSKEEDLLLLNTLLKIKPRVLVLDDIHSSKLFLLEPKLRWRARNVLTDRVVFILNKHITPDSPYAYHIDGPNAPFTPLYEALQFCKEQVEANAEVESTRPPIARVPQRILDCIGFYRPNRPVALSSDRVDANDDLS